MFVLGTAGHVDHGKSTLVKALTGINPDRLKEEQKREMTIELGFAWTTLPNGEEIGIVDVPGHRDFIENMLSGVGGIDAVVFVVAADEGVMPQTREHLAIVDILQIPTGIIALTKIDLVDDPEWLDMVEEELREALAGTVLQDAPILRVSARKGQGLDTLTAALEECLREAPQRANTGRPRLAIDRVFTISGFGTVVTGTLVDGALHVGDEVEILPEGIKGRVRGLQTHKQKEEMSQPGSRTAVNISGVDADQIRRGDVLIHPGDYRPTDRMDVRFRLLPDAGVHVRHNMDVKVFLGATETPGRIRLLGADELAPGEEGWLQLELERALVAVRGDHYILRRPSPGETLGGGLVVDPHPKRRHKRFNPDLLERLEKMLHGTPEDLVYQALTQTGPSEVKDLADKARLPADAFHAALTNLLTNGQAKTVQGAEERPEIVITAPQLAQITGQVSALIAEYHKRFPLKAGMPREEMKSRLKFTPRVFNALMGVWLSAGVLAEESSTLHAPGYQIRFTPEQEKQVEALMRQIAQAPYSPPTVKECIQMVGEDVFEALLALDKMVLLNQEVAFAREDYNHLVTDITARLQKGETITVAGFRDIYNTSRRYALAFLEHLDQIGVTRRVGDERTLKKK